MLFVDVDIRVAQTDLWYGDGPFPVASWLEAEIMVVCTENHIRVYQVTESEW